MTEHVSWSHLGSLVLMLLGGQQAPNLDLLCGGGEVRGQLQSSGWPGWYTFLVALVFFYFLSLVSPLLVLPLFLFIIIIIWFSFHYIIMVADTKVITESDW